jgi:PIN domain nuclease of toxin-antitoxin system
MIPDIEVQLQSVIKSLKDNVLPAVDAENELAQQQIQLSMATLGIVQEHLPLVHSVVRKDMISHVELAEALLELATESEPKARLQQSTTEARTALNDASLGFVQLQQQARELRDEIGLFISDHAQSSAADAIERRVLAASKSLLDLGRAWNKPMGFEPDPKAVTELADQVGG